jgi:hypothetical protein
MGNKKNLPYKRLVIEGDYCDFQNFYESNKKLIYDSIFETFNGFVYENKPKLSLFVSTMIENVPWETEFIFKRKDHLILTRDLKPFYESIEDYEMCNKLIKLDEYFTI